MNNLSSSKWLFLPKLCFTIILFLWCLAAFLYLVLWVAVLIFYIPQYIWIDTNIQFYKIYKIIACPILICGLFWALFVLKRQNEIILKKIKAIYANEETYKDVYSKVSLIATLLHIPKPKIYFVEDYGTNSILISNKKKESAIIFSKSILDKNDLETITIMSAYHLQNIRSKKNMLNTYIIALTSCFSWGFEAITNRTLKKNETSKATYKAIKYLLYPLQIIFAIIIFPVVTFLGYKINRNDKIDNFRILLYPIRLILLPLVAILSVFALYDRLIAPILSFFCAANSTIQQDKQAIMLLKTPQKYINTLYKVHENPRVTAFENGATFISCFQDPTIHLAFFKIMKQHPSIDERIQIIKESFKAYFIYEKEE